MFPEKLLLLFLFRRLRRRRLVARLSLRGVAVRAERERVDAGHALLHQTHGHELVQFRFRAGFRAFRPHDVLLRRDVPQPIRPGFEPGLALGVHGERRALYERAPQLQTATLFFHRKAFRRFA